MGDYITKVKQLFEAAGSSWCVCMTNETGVISSPCRLLGVFITMNKLCTLFLLLYVIYSRNSLIYFYSCGYYKGDFYTRMVMERSESNCMNCLIHLYMLCYECHIVTMYSFSCYFQWWWTETVIFSTFDKDDNETRQ